MYAQIFVDGKIVGTGAGKIIQGAGQGVGHVFGGGKFSCASKCLSISFTGYILTHMFLL